MIKNDLYTNQGETACRVNVINLREVEDGFPLFLQKRKPHWLTEGQ